MAKQIKKILVLFAHPAFHKSKVHALLTKSIEDLDGVTLHNLYETYPDFFIDVKKEQTLLLEHDIIVWQHPFYWYSSPALLKEWIDLVLEHGFAYGKNASALEGKSVFSAISTGGSKEVYCSEGRNKYTIQEFLIPFQQTAALCKMNYLPPFVVHGTYVRDKDTIRAIAVEYRKLIIGLRDNLYSSEDIENASYLNTIIA